MLMYHSVLGMLSEESPIEALRANRMCIRAGTVVDTRTHASDLIVKESRATDAIHEVELHPTSVYVPVHVEHEVLDAAMAHV